jgi:membrane protein required for beta-lactamase induction
MSSTFLTALARVLSTRLRQARTTGRDAGASALEWAVIAAVVVVAASLIGGAVYKIVQDKSKALETCATVAVGGAC